ncbi:hypothetical protein OCU04_007117 [Sclerotinia nivalis]|uniref:Uncharacterized protein n=1 Tax=Sclerotinia nivalis TaxID=352851 RepID=A0A9X0AL55_9HELO|nr:hypothetical protein OCU04_007117 [Sclerotinia nivalis]
MRDCGEESKICSCLNCSILCEQFNNFHDHALASMNSQATEDAIIIANAKDITDEPREFAEMKTRKAVLITKQWSWNITLAADIEQNTNDSSNYYSKIGYTTIKRS